MRPWYELWVLYGVTSLAAGWLLLDVSIWWLDKKGRRR